MHRLSTTTGNSWSHHGRASSLRLRVTPRGRFLPQFRLSLAQTGAIAPFIAFLPLFGASFLTALRGLGASLSHSCLALILCFVLFCSGTVRAVLSAPARGFLGSSKVPL